MSLAPSPTPAASPADAPLEASQPAQPAFRTVNVERLPMFAFYRFVEVTAGAEFAVTEVSEQPPKALWRARGPEAGAALDGPFRPGELHGSFLFLRGRERPRLGAPLEERLAFLARSYGAQAKPGARTPLGITQPLRRDLSGVYLPFIADQGLPAEVAPDLPGDVESHFVVAGTAIEHVVVHIEAIRRGAPGERFDLEETLALVKGRILRLRAANGLVDAPIATGLASFGLK